jgi:thiamine pyrophosphate-dependent acetolactate synthase large subunit-like protein
VGLGAQGERVTRREELDPALTRAFTAARTGIPFVIDVACDPAVVSQLLRGLDELGLM